MKAKPVKNWELERYLLQELSPSRMLEIAELLENDPDLRKHHDELKKSNVQILELHPPERTVPGIERTIEKKKHEVKKKKARKFPKKWFYVFPVLATALLVFVVQRDQNSPSYQDLQQGIRIKGEEGIDMSQPQIIIYRKLGAQAEVVKNGESVSQGDLLQIAYVAAGKAFGVIFSIDGSGVITLHHPDQRERPNNLIQEKKVLLESAYELDDAPHFERFFFIVSAEEFNVTYILELAERLAASPKSVRTSELSLPKTFTQFSILLVKEIDDES